MEFSSPSLGLMSSLLNMGLRLYHVSLFISLFHPSELLILTFVIVKNQILLILAYCDVVPHHWNDISLCG